MKPLEFSFVCDILVSPSPHDHPHMCTLIMIEKRFCLAAGLLGGHSECWRQGHKSALLCKRTTSPSFDQQFDNTRLYDRDGFCIVYNVLCNMCILQCVHCVACVCIAAHCVACAFCIMCNVLCKILWDLKQIQLFRRSQDSVDNVDILIFFMGCPKNFSF